MTCQLFVQQRKSVFWSIKGIPENGVYHFPNMTKTSKPTSRTSKSTDLLSLSNEQKKARAEQKAKLIAVHEAVEPTSHQTSHQPEFEDFSDLEDFSVVEEETVAETTEEAPAAEASNEEETA